MAWAEFFFSLKDVFDIEEFSTTITLTSIKSVSLVWICTSKYSFGEEDDLRFAPTATTYPTISKTIKENPCSCLLPKLTSGLCRHKLQKLVENSDPGVEVHAPQNRIWKTLYIVSRQRSGTICH